MHLSTRHKIALASAAHRLVRMTRSALGLRQSGRFRRGDLVWDLDLDEGIDFAIWLLGGFERDLVRYLAAHVRPGDVVLDIGANIGAHTLPFARAVGDTGRVLAFEATAFAYAKLAANLQANPHLRSRVLAHHALLVADTEVPHETSIASSWPLSGRPADDPVLGGALKPVGQARVATLDQIVAEAAPGRIDWLKIDVDGHEVGILRGAAKTLADFRPRLVIELAPYCFRNGPDTFADLISLLASHRYRLHTIPRETPLPMDARVLERQHIPRDGSINALAIAVSP